MEHMAKGASTELGTGGMSTKIKAAKIATAVGADMVIANGENIYTINDVMAGKRVGTLFLSRDNRKRAENRAAEKSRIRRQTSGRPGIEAEKENESEHSAEAVKTNMDSENPGI